MSTSRGRRSRASVAGSSGLAWIEDRLGITPKGVLLVAVAVAGWVLARIVGSRSLFLLVYGLVAALGVSWLLGRRRLAVDAVRSELPPRVREGQLIDVSISLTASRRLSTIILEERVAPELGSVVRVPVPVLPAGETVTHQYALRPRRRGVHHLGPLLATWSDPFGLTRRKVQLAAEQEVIVHPSTELVHDRVLSREWEDPPVRPPNTKPWPTGFEFYGMRDYTPGDDPRRIVWSATARHVDFDHPENDRVFVRESEQGITDRVAVVLDTFASGYGSEEPNEPFERAVRTVASLVQQHLRSGFSVTVETNAARLLSRLHGQTARIRALDALARIDRDKEPLSGLLDRLLANPARERHLVIVSPHIDDTAATRIRLLRSRGVSILVAVILTDDTDRAMLHRVGSLGTSITEVVAGAPLQASFGRVLGAGARKL